MDQKRKADPREEIPAMAHRSPAPGSKPEEAAAEITGGPRGYCIPRFYTWGPEATRQRQRYKLNPGPFSRRRNPGRRQMADSATAARNERLRKERPDVHSLHRAIL